MLFAAQMPKIRNRFVKLRDGTGDRSPLYSNPDDEDGKPYRNKDGGGYYDGHTAKTVTIVDGKGKEVPFNLRDYLVGGGDSVDDGGDDEGDDDEGDDDDGLTGRGAGEGYCRAERCRLHARRRRGVERAVPHPDKDPPHGKHKPAPFQLSTEDREVEAGPPPLVCSHESMR